MKRTLSILTACILLVGMMLTLVSCGGALSGTYEGAAFDLKFSGDNVTVIVGEGDDKAELKGTYEVKEDDDGNKKISFDFIDEEDATEEQKSILKIIDTIVGTDLPLKEEGNKITIAYILSFTKK